MWMKDLLILGVGVLGVLGLSHASEGQGNIKVQVETSEGTITLELYPDKAPTTVENFLSYVKDGHYANTIFHRVIDGFMVQGGGFTEDLQQKPTKAAIVNEASNGLKNERGTIAMARTMEVNSATAQFFINLVDNGFLDHRDMTPNGYGYCVFGKVIDGMEVIDKIGKTTTTTRDYLRDVPKDPIVIKRMVIVE